MSLNMVFTIIAFSMLGILMIVIWPMAYFFVALHYDKIFPETKKDKHAVYRNMASLDPIQYLLRGSIRGVCYLICIACYGIRKSKMSVFGNLYPDYYHDYNWHKNARLIDWILIWTFIISFSTMLLSVACSIIIQGGVS